MPQWLFWFLSTTVIVVPIIGFGTMFYLRHKNKKIIENIIENDEMNSLPKHELVYLDNKYIDLIKDSFWTIQELNFLLNTIKKNNFSNVAIFGKTTGSEILILINQLILNGYVFEDFLDKKEYQEYLANKNIFPKGAIFLDKANLPLLDLVIIRDNEKKEVELNEYFDLAWKNSKPGAIIIVVNIKNKDKKEFIKYLNLIGTSYQFENSQNNSILLIKR